MALNSKKLIFDAQILDLTINRLCQHLIENHADFKDTVLVGLQPRGVFLAERIKDRLLIKFKTQTTLGQLDTTFYRDDFRRGSHPISANTTNIEFMIENKRVVLIDDVLCSGRTVRAALDAVLAFGRPAKIELLVLINRKYNRELPIEPSYVGKHVNTLQSQKVLVELKEQTKKEDKIWLVSKE